MRFSVLSSLAAVSAATDLLLPLYNYPGTNGSAWAGVHDALATHPRVQAKIIINFNSGPSPGAPGPDWTAGGEALASLPNVALLGYVPVNRTNPTPGLDAAKANVTAWAAWTTNYGVNISGIFVDEAPNSDCGPCLSYMQNLTTYIRGTAGMDVVVYNPGSAAANHSLDAYYALNPTFVVALETCFSNTTNGIDGCREPYTHYDEDGYGTTIDNTLSQRVGTQYYNKTAILIHGFHGTNGMYNATTDVLNREVMEVVQRGIGAADFTTNEWTTPDAPLADVGTVVAALDAANHQ